jgi:sugar diacid utilization regulator
MEEAFSMALTLRELFNETQERFQLRCLAAEDAMDHVVTWVHLVEDDSMVDFFWGNELLVTSGCLARTAEGLCHLVERLNEKHCVGLVINVGKYVEQVPQEVIDLCDQLRVPLFTMPWEMYITGFVKFCCSRINQSSQEGEDLSKAVVRAILSPNEQGDYYTKLTDYFDNDAGYQLLAVFVDVSDQVRRLGLHIAELRFHTALNNWGFRYLVFPYEGRYVMVLNQTDPQVTEQIAHHLVDIYHATRAEENMRINVGIGEPVKEVTQLTSAYHSALSAVRRAQLTRVDVVRFRDMSFYKLLYSLPSSRLMMEYYHEVMGPLLEHDKKHGSSYLETLCRYLLHDGSLQAVADEMYTHRNTVNYRMGRIREILGSNLATHEECFPYLMAYYIGVILKEQDDYRE